jgi:hypothetical protein
MHICPYTQIDADNVVDMIEELPKLNSVTHLRVTNSYWQHMYGASIAKLLSRCCQLQRLDVYADNPLVEKRSSIPVPEGH